MSAGTDDTDVEAPEGVVVADGDDVDVDRTEVDVDRGPAGLVVVDEVDAVGTDVAVPVVGDGVSRTGTASGAGVGGGRTST